MNNKSVESTQVGKRRKVAVGASQACVQATLASATAVSKSSIPFAQPRVSDISIPDACWNLPLMSEINNMPNHPPDVNM